MCVLKLYKSRDGGGKRVGKNMKKKLPGWPYMYYLVFPPQRFIYCSIPKVASGSLRRWMLRLEGIESSTLSVSGATAARDRYQIKLDQMHLLTDPAWFKFVFVRNPFSRLVSAFLNRFCRPNDCPIVAGIRQQAGGPEGVTFRQFIEHICPMPDVELGPGWQSQRGYMANTPFDFVGRFERLIDDVRWLCPKIGLPVQSAELMPTGEGNITPYRMTDRSICDAADIPDKVLLAAGKDLPTCSDMFSDRKLADLVVERYLGDFQDLGYSTTIKS